MRKNLHYLLLMLAFAVVLQATAAVPSGYYDNAKNKSDRALMLALHKIIRGHTKRSYSNLWTDFKKTDCNGNIIIDRYSTTQYTYQTSQCGNSGYNGVGDCYNREHSIPNSWWGGSDSDTAYTDLHHMFPVDGWVNNERGNNPFGNCANGTPKGTGKLGSCTFSGYSGTVFEVADEYKGDFARVYFYFATRYMMRMSNYTSGSSVFNSSSYLGLDTWAINQMLEWHRNDPVSTLETNRNDAVYSIQHNRNPFVDNPELVEYIWGNKQGSTWPNGGGTPTPVLTSPANGSTVNVGTNTGNGVSKSITVQGGNLTKALTVSVSGTGFSVTPTSVSATNANNGTTVTVTYNGTSSNATGTLTISSSEVSTSVTLTASYNNGGGVEPGDEIIETWEGCNTGGYWADQIVQGKAFSWHFSNAGIWADANSNGAQSCRFGKNANSYIEMAEDVSGGASKVTFYAANWSGDATPTLQLQYSTNGGSTWTNAGTCSPSSTWKQYIFNLNVMGNVRFKILQTAGSRLNIDDIAITSNAAPVTNPQITAPVNGSIVDVGTIEAAGSSVSKTIMVKGSDLTKALNLSVSGTGFSVSPATISAANANNGTNITVTYTSSVAGTATGTLTIGSTEATVTVNLTASKIAMPTISIIRPAAVQAEQNGESTCEQGSVSADDNSENITLSVEGNFELSLNKYSWSRTLTLDPTGEVFYVRLADTGTVGDYYGTITATTGVVSAYADVEGSVSAKPVQPGDVNMDGTVDIADATTLINYLLYGEASPFSAEAADLTLDTFIDIADATSLINILLYGLPQKHVTHWDAVPVTGGIHIEKTGSEVLEVYDFDANCCAVISSAGSVDIELPQGIYIVSGDTASRKVVVK